MKTCKTCCVPKELSDFGPDHRSKDGKKGRCRVCCSRYQVEWQKSHPQKLRIYSGRWKAKNKEHCLDVDRKRRKRDRAADPAKFRVWETAQRCRKYGVTPKWLDEQTAKQNGLCALCGEIPGGRGLCIDHCHKTGRVRALLCTHCNTGLHKMERDIEWVRKAEAYLMEFD